MRDDDIEWLRFVQNAEGAIIGPMDAWLVLRGTKTLPIKMLQYIEEAPDPTLAALSTLILAGTIVLLVLSDRVVGLHRMAGTAD